MRATDFNPLAQEVSMQVDFGKTAKDYGAHRAVFPATFFERLRALHIGIPGQKLLDLGTGTGALARVFAKQGCAVTGVDISSSLLQEAERLARTEDLNIDWRESPAEETSLPSASFDVVSAGQCWHWFSREKAAREIHRLLQPGGSLIIAHFDWLSKPSNIVDVSLKIAKRHRDTPPPAVLNVGIRGTYCLWLEEIEEANFTQIETFSFDVEVPYSGEAWRGRMRASAIGGGTMNPAQLAAFDQSLMTALKEYPEVFTVPHRVFAIIAKR
jgi:SAM-dependent methyltransferase